MKPTSPETCWPRFAILLAPLVFLCGCATEPKPQPAENHPKFAEAKSAAQGGNARAQDELGQIYFGAYPAQYQQGVSWYHQAADRGWPPAQTHLGVAYASGLGVPQNYRQAMRWFRLAADQGDAEGQFHLGNMYATGRNFRIDRAEAYKWYCLAAAQGHKVAVRARDNTARKMSIEEIDEGQRRATRFVARGATTAPVAVVNPSPAPSAESNPAAESNSPAAAQSGPLRSPKDAP